MRRPSWGWLRWVCCILAVVLPAQAALLLVARAQGPAHGHTARPSGQTPQALRAEPGRQAGDWRAQPAWGATVSPQQVRAALRKAHGSRNGGAPWFAARLLPPQHHAHGAGLGHSHDADERHHHAAGDPSVVPADPLEGANPAAGATAESGVWAPPVPAAPGCASHRERRAPCLHVGAWVTHVAALPEKPPKVS